MGITISPGESFNLLANSFGGGSIRLTDLTTKTYTSKLPPAVATVPPEHIRGYVHNKKVNHYLLGSNLGEGSFAKVKEAFHVMVGEKVAMKVIDKKKAMQDPYVAKNFKREAKLLKMIRHPNILQLLEVIETDSSFYLITELCSGGELMKYIYKKGQLDESETRKFMRQIVSAVDHMHKAGIIHRDLKVENMLLDSNMDIKIIDFGLSNEEYVQGENGLTHCSTQCGSPAYAAPELLGHKSYGPQVDIWSIGVNMYAMLTGCLPYTVEPFNITALHAKMLENKMNPIPDNLSEKCKDLLKQLLRSNPTERLNMSGIMSHPWMNEGHPLPFGPAPFPNKLQLTDINSDIMQHMIHVLKLKDTEEELLQEVVSNRSTPSGAIYFMLLARLARYNKNFPHAPRVRHKSRVSRDQGYFEDEDIETQSIRSMPTTKSSRHSTRSTNVQLRQNRAGGGGKDQSTDKEEPNLAQTMPAGYTFKRRQTMPEFMLKEDVVRAREAHQRKERDIAAMKHDSLKTSTRPTTQSIEHRRKRHTFPNSGSNEDSYSHPPDSGGPTLAPVRLTHTMRRNYSTPSALNQIREDLNSQLGPNSSGAGGVINAWHSNPSSRNPSRNPSRQGSRQPSGQMTRAVSNSTIHSRHESYDADDDHQDDLVFHDVWSNSLPRTSKKKIFTIGQDSTDANSHSHLPSISEATSATRKRAYTDILPERRNGSSPQIKVVEIKTELGVNEVLTEIIRAAHSLKMRDIEQIGSSVMFMWNGTKFQVSFSRNHSSNCRLTYQWLSGGDLQTYKGKCDKLSRKLRL